MNIQTWPKNTKTLPLSELFTTAQMKEIIRLHTNTVGSAPKAYFEYIQTQPDILEKCKAKEVLPEYLVYYLEYVLTEVRSG